jgi:hypothetical protein
MPNVDQFESVFKAAAKTPYAYEPVKIERVAVLTDLDQDQADALTQRVRDWLAVLGEGITWQAMPEGRTRTVDQLLEAIRENEPDLLVTYRNLHSPGWQWPHTLGRRLDTLTQATHKPVLVIPHPEDDALDRAMQDTNRVMAMADHLSGDHRLVNYAMRFTQPGGVMYLTHVEDEQTFARYIDAISKIPSIDTDNAREQILAQLLKEPTDYIESCRRVLDEHDIDISTQRIVTTGHHLSTYQLLVEQHTVDLLVINTKDEDQSAMHGLAHPLAMELRTTPLLML